jgi:broad specificity phosphatase PhoE
MKFLLFFICMSLGFFHLFSKETTFLLVRHGETDWNLERRVQGHTDNPLNDKGIRQAEEVALKIFQEHSDIDVIYSSDLKRAYQTANETAKYLQLDINQSEAFREINNGLSEGLIIEEKIKLYGAAFEKLNRQYPNRKERWDYASVPCAETFNQLLNRFQGKLIEIAEEYPGKKIAIFTHSKAIKTFISEVLDTNEMLDVSNCGVYEFIYDDSADKAFRIKSPLLGGFYKQRYD